MFASCSVITYSQTMRSHYAYQVFFLGLKLVTCHSVAPDHDVSLLVLAPGTLQSDYAC